MRMAESSTRDVELLKKAVSMSQLDLDTLRAGDLLNVKEDLYDITRRGQGGGDHHKEEFLRRLTPEKIGIIQARFRHCFESLVEGEKSIFWTVDTRTELIVGVHWENIKQ